MKEDILSLLSISGDKIICLSEHLVQWMADNDVPPIILKEMKESYLFYEKGYQKMSTIMPDPIIRAGIFQKELDRIVKHELGQHTPSCKPGCSYCCTITVATTKDEKELIDLFVKQKNLTLNQTPKKCLYLKDNLCQIYEVRPGACRKYFSIGDPETCNLDIDPDAIVLKPMLIEAEICWSAAGNVNGLVEVHKLEK